MTASEQKKQIQKRFITSVTFTGGNRLGSKNTIRRHTWLGTILLACIACSVHLYLCVDEYRLYAVNTLIEHHAFSFLFPDISICSTAPFCAKKRILGARSGLSSAQRFWYRALMGNDLSQLADLDRQEQTFLKAVLSFKQYNDEYNNQDVFVDMLQNVRHCAYRGRPCHLNNFTHFRSSRRFNCITLTPVDRRLDVADKRKGLQIILNVVDGFIESDSNTALHEMVGVEIMVHAPGTLPPVRKDALSIQPGHQVTLKLSMDNTSYVSTKQKPCYSDSEIKTRLQNLVKSITDIDIPIDKFHKVYTSEDCLHIMTTLEIIRKCQCITEEFNLLWTWNTTKYPRCHELPKQFFFNEKIDRWGELHFRNKTYNILHDEHVTNVRDRALCVDAYTKAMFENVELNELLQLCPNQCYKSEYHKDVALSRWPQNKTLTKEILNTISNSDTKSFVLFQKDIADANELDNMISIIVYPSDLTVDVTSETLAYPMSQLFSDFGGNMGLWIGVSLLTMAEIVEFIIRVIILRVKGNNVQTNVGPTGIVVCTDGPDLEGNYTGGSFDAEASQKNENESESDVAKNEGENNINDNADVVNVNNKENDVLESNKEGDIGENVHNGENDIGETEDIDNTAVNDTSKCVSM